MKVISAWYDVHEMSLDTVSDRDFYRIPVPDPSDPEDGGFDVMDPANVSPLVVWLGSSESKDVTGQCFELSGGEICVNDGWRMGPKIDKGARWEADEVGAAVHDLLSKAVPNENVHGT